jgi:hypothetical protein
MLERRPSSGAPAERLIEATSNLSDDPGWLRAAPMIVIASNNFLTGSRVIVTYTNTRPMSAICYDLDGTRVLLCPREGEKLRNDRDAVELIGDALGKGAGVVVIPAERFEDDFFRLRTGIAGQIVQKFVTYRLRLAIIGDIHTLATQSSTLRDFVVESNRGNHIWFLADLAALEHQLQSRRLQNRNT